ncbi:hypothetical protein A2Z67_03865, partial [Candidatus Woesebacteria bacterium RBG_13_36_22]
MKLVICSDLQFNNWQEFSKILPNGKNSRFQDQLNVLDEIFEVSIALSKDDDVILVHTGDLFESMTEKIDKAVFLDVFNKFSEFSKEGVATILLLGNHDFIDKTETRNIIEPFKEIKTLLVVDKPMVQVVNGVGLNFVPYTRQDFISKVGSLANTSLKPTYLFTHQGINGALTGPRDIPMKEDYNPKDFRPDVFDIVFNGHFHKPQNFGNLQIVGSGLQKDFGERNDEKGYWILDTGKDPKHPIYVKTNGPRFYKIEISKEEEIYLPKTFRPCDFLWVVSQGIGSDRVAEILGKNKDTNLTNIRIEVVSERVVKTRTEISISMPAKEQIKKYVDYCDTGDLDKDKLLELAMNKY